MRRWLQEHGAIVALLLIAVVVGVLVADDWGITWDEPQQRVIGHVSYEYVFGDDRLGLHDFRDRDYGVVVELPLVLLERLLAPQSPREVIATRHLVVHLYFLSGVAALYLLVLRLFGSRALAIFACLGLLLHPRLYAHSFFNSKDIPFLVTYLYAFLLAHLAFERRRLGHWIALGVVTGLLINQRLMGALLPVLILAMLALVCIRARTAPVAPRRRGLRRRRRHYPVHHLALFVGGPAHELRRRLPQHEPLPLERGGALLWADDPRD